MNESIGHWKLTAETRSAFPIITIRSFPTKERDEREEFAVEACYLMRDRFMGEEIWENLGLDVRGCAEHVRQSPFMQQYTKALFSRIVPTIKDIGLWGPRIRAAYVDMGVMEFADIDVEEMSRHDENVAAEFDRLRAKRDAHINEVIAAGSADA